MDKPKLECVDCNPSRTFRSVSGLNGHMQFKHDKTGVFSGRPPSKQTEMIQQLLDQQKQILDQHHALYELIADQFGKSVSVDEPIGVFVGGNGNGNPGNNHQGNNNGNQFNVDQDDDEQVYTCDGCGTPVSLGQARCSSCKERLNWKNVAVN